MSQWVSTSLSSNGAETSLFLERSRWRSPRAFLKISALGVEEQRVKVRVNFVNLPNNITTWSRDDVLRVPAAALFRRDKDWMTFTVEDNRAKLTRVAIDHNNGEFAEVTDGLVEGQRVILYPADTIADGVSC